MCFIQSLKTMGKRLGASSLKSSDLFTDSQVYNPNNKVQHGSTGHMDVSKNRGGPPKSSHFNRVFHYKPSILGAHPYILETSIAPYHQRTLHYLCFCRVVAPTQNTTPPSGTVTFSAGKVVNTFRHFLGRHLQILEPANHGIQAFLHIKLNTLEPKAKNFCC